MMSWQNEDQCSGACNFDAEQILTPTFLSFLRFKDWRPHESSVSHVSWMQASPFTADFAYIKHCFGALDGDPPDGNSALVRGKFVDRDH
jgi:hypothetical protein